ncbi:MAG TPA: hypothetical protein VNS09_22135 [Solirubrobacter sp.]|nr:hypothetical protein [Solirubrobacter sp.]
MPWIFLAIFLFWVLVVVVVFTVLVKTGKLKLDRDAKNRLDGPSGGGTTGW